MKKIISSAIAKLPVFLMAFLLPFQVFSQEAPTWFEPGSSWVYNYQTIAGPEQHQATFEISEAVFAGHNCVKMEAIGNYPFLCTPFETPIYFYQSNDSVFYATEAEENFRLAYDFNAQVGDEWEYELLISGTTVNHFYVEVIEVNTVTIDGNEVKEMVLKYDNFSEEPHVEIFPQEIVVREYLGATNTFFIPLGHLLACDAETSIALQCFHSPSFDYVNPEFGTCTVSSSTSDTPEFLKVYPNPANDYIQIHTPTNEKSIIRIFQSNGKLVLHRYLAANTEKISVSELSPGMYIIEILDGENPYFEKLVIGH